MWMIGSGGRCGGRRGLRGYVLLLFYGLSLPETRLERGFAERVRGRTDRGMFLAPLRLTHN